MINQKKAIRPPKEKNLHQHVCDYLNMQYPSVMFFSDASGMRVGMGLRNELKRKRCKKWKIPDLHILEPRGPYAGLVIELKRERCEVYKKDGSLIADERIQAQAEALAHLRSVGYYADFGIGFDHCKEIVDWYMKLGSKGVIPEDVVKKFYNKFG